MALDATTLPDGVAITTHGCGPYFPDVPSGRDDDVPENRRVEIFVVREGGVQAFQPVIPGGARK